VDIGKAGGMAEGKAKKWRGGEREGMERKVRCWIFSRLQNFPPASTDAVGKMCAELEAPYVVEEE